MNGKMLVTIWSAALRRNRDHSSHVLKVRCVLNDHYTPIIFYKELR
jgi:hypothetical protein